MTIRTLTFDDSPPTSPVRSSILTPKKDLNQKIQQTLTTALSSIPDHKMGEFSIRKPNKLKKENIRPADAKAAQPEKKTPEPQRTYVFVSPVKSAAASTASPTAQSTPSTPPHSEPKRQCSDGDAKDLKRYVAREEVLSDPTRSAPPFVREAWDLTWSDTVNINGVQYQKKQVIGRGNHCEVFRTQFPGLVVKHLHREAITQLWADTGMYWQGIKHNTEQAGKKQISVARIFNVKTLTIVAVQPEYIFLHKISVLSSSILNQVKDIVWKCDKHGMVLEFKKENLGLDPQTQQVCIVDVDNAFAEHGQQINFNLSLGSFGEKIAQWLDPRNKTPQ